MQRLAVDFGTSNSAAAFWRDGAVQRIALEPGGDTLPTAVFFDFTAKQMLIGTPAGEALLAGDEGRYMRALKSLLGSPLMRERRNLLGERLDFIDIVARFLKRLKSASEAAAGTSFDAVLSGRPVGFHPDPARDAQALADLQEAYGRAGFGDVSFMYEPEAAAWANSASLSADALGLVVDIGGGTSDFTLFRTEGDGIDILASHGIRVGGTDFDRALSLDLVMPLLGRGGQVRHAFGDKTHIAPAAIFNDLANWAKIPFLYNPDTRRLAKDLARNGAEGAGFDRLLGVLEDELGHDVAFAVEAGKIAANAAGEGRIDLAEVERGLAVPVTFSMVSDTLDALTAQIGEAALETLAGAGKTPDAVGHVIFVGGSSLMGTVQTAISRVLPAAQVHRGAALTAIVDGLAIATGSAESP
ncbi:Hsp70 family protein [Sulfitobacter sp. HNIBRBA3233]|uniref:Hsp70 family protein n=1 Tax=Sulfitobacter marinivivus TaxID=3158558 RepID=UPI0032DEF3F6